MGCAIIYMYNWYITKNNLFSYIEWHDTVTKEIKYITDWAYTHFKQQYHNFMTSKVKRKCFFKKILVKHKNIIMK